MEGASSASQFGCDSTTDKGGQGASPNTGTVQGGVSSSGQQSDKSNNEKCSIESIDIQINKQSIPIFDKKGIKNNKLYIITDEKGTDITLNVKRKGKCGVVPKDPEKKHPENIKIITKKNKSEEKIDANTTKKSTKPEWKEESLPAKDGESVKINYYDHDYIVATHNEQINRIIKKMFDDICAPLFNFIKQYTELDLRTPKWDYSKFLLNVEFLPYMDFLKLEEIDSNNKLWKNTQITFEDCTSSKKNVNIFSYPNGEFHVVVKLNLKEWVKKWKNRNGSSNQTKTQEEKTEQDSKQRDIIVKEISDSFDNFFKNRNDDKDRKLDDASKLFNIEIYYAYGDGGKKRSLLDSSKIFSFLDLVFSSCSKIAGLLDDIKYIEKPELKSANICVDFAWKYAASDDSTKLGSAKIIKVDVELDGDLLTIHLLELLLSKIPYVGKLIAKTSLLSKNALEILGQKNNLNWYVDLILSLRGKAGIINDKKTISSIESSTTNWPFEIKLNAELSAGITAKGAMGCLIEGIGNNLQFAGPAGSVAGAGVNIVGAIASKAGEVTGSETMKKMGGAICSSETEKSRAGKASFTLAGKFCDPLAFCFSFDGINITALMWKRIDLYTITKLTGEEDGGNYLLRPRCVINYHSDSGWGSSVTNKSECPFMETEKEANKYVRSDCAYWKWLETPEHTKWKTQKSIVDSFREGGAKLVGGLENSIKSAYGLPTFL